ncbi:PREDICTED: uncharacterized protein LOC105109878 isoform X1 [Populus euphratica]|uniref:Uncharacterized protein LOC105109878 isoform X1 n=2 Tax=Populus euphratica TaxID=75702 RepID=A0AAJ6X280_POPEU|nr:PREDICTED: uncharacterized protein LOC105109878 isoform X1 [Populus euphratica]
MMKFNCFSCRIGRKKNEKVDKQSSRTADINTALKTLNIRLQHPVEPFESDGLKSTSFGVSFPLDVEKDSINVQVMSHQSPVVNEAAYEGEDELEEDVSLKRDLSDLDLQSHVANSGEEVSFPISARLDSSDSLDRMGNERYAKNDEEKVDEKGIDVIQSGHVSDPGIGKAEFWGSPKLKRSCSNLETSKFLRKIANQLPLASQYSEELQGLAEKLRDPGSPTSIISRCSADRVMLKKHSSSQVLPSRSRRLWWKLFLWSHRNLHKPWYVKPQPQAVSKVLNQQGGYSSDTLELDRALSKMQSPGSFTRESMNKGHNNNGEDSQSWNGFHAGISGLWPQNQWVAFSIESSPFSRVNKWVEDLETQPPPPDAHDDNNDVKSDDGIVFLPSPDTGRSPGRTTACPDFNFSEEILHANSVIQSLNSSSTVAHIAGIGLKAIPTISHFSSLRSVNLSNNVIVHITPGSLPKGLHTLNLSKNRIGTIEGLRDLIRLRVLDLSYNRISRLGQGLSNCTIIKELYLAGNKISDVEGLHRLLKLTVLDLSFNKITTTKALGQLVAHYNSLQALNLLGNPIQSNISDDQLRKAICGLLPKLVYLNKQPIKPQRAREVLTDSVARAALGTGSSRSYRKKAVKRVTSSSSISSMHRGSVGGGQKSRNRSNSRTHHLKTLSSAHASSSR